MKKIITCHCKNIKISVVFPEIITPVKCNCSICQRRNAKMAVVEKKDVKVLIGSEFIKSYKFHTKVAEHFFVQIAVYILTIFKEEILLK